MFIYDADLERLNFFATSRSFFHHQHDSFVMGARRQEKALTEREAEALA